MNLPFPLLPRWVRWSFVGIIAAVIVYFSILTAPPETPIDAVRFELIPLDKWRHFVAYAAFAGSIAYATTEWDIRKRRLAAGIVIVTIIFGFAIELVQSLFPLRYYSLLDAYANALGALVVLPWYKIENRLEFVGFGPSLNFGEKK